jgi:hypothetical protein
VSTNYKVSITYPDGHSVGSSFGTDAERAQLELRTIEAILPNYQPGTKITIEIGGKKKS